MMNRPGHWLTATAACDDLEMPPRQLNPTLSYLIQQDAVMAGSNVDPVFVTSQIQKNSRTLAFIREHS